ncbi:helix-turn-helix domain-containing protein [Streptomyces avicenniae]|uniref:helix-turn-helix domain-containing protein n=1 Tax=Streptomyces avicenniae TaxID=500153 RepID=UPI0006995BFD|nr:helix-turn-helix domain-containing protein [Streptomyces avicenniae]
MSEQDNELGLFLRSRREAVRPADVGLPTGARRRTPGLRRSELATLAGVSVEYLTRLEQGRDRRPSAAVLSTLAEALRLGMGERVHLYRLTKAADGFRCSSGPIEPVRTVRPTVAALLARLEPTPAVLLNQLSEILAYTGGYERLARPLGLLDGDPPSLARFLFTDARARSVYPDWEHVADEQVAALKEGPFRHDAHMAALADELTVAAGDEFARRADSVPGLPRRSGVTRLAHPGAGELRLAYETLELTTEDQRILVHLPADEATAAALARLDAPGPRTLRAVTG